MTNTYRIIRYMGKYAIQKKCFWGWKYERNVIDGAVSTWATAAGALDVLKLWKYNKEHHGQIVRDNIEV